MDEVKTAQVKIYAYLSLQLNVEKKSQVYSLFVCSIFVIQPVEQLAFFGAMSTPPDVQAPNVSVMAYFRFFFLFVFNNSINHISLE